MAVGRGTEREECATPLADQWPNLGFLGLGAWWAWIWLCYNSIELVRMFPSDDQTSYVLEMYLCSTLGIAAVMLVAAVAWKRVTPYIDRHLVVVGFGGLAGLSTFLLGYSAVMGGGVFFLIATVFTGIGTSVLCLKVGRAYGSVALGESLTAGGISLLFAALLYYVGVGIPPECRLLYLSALPVLSALLLSLTGNDPYASAVSGAGEAAGKNALQRRIYRKLVVASGLVAVTAGIGKGISSILMTNQEFAREGTVIVFCIGVIAVAAVMAVNCRQGAAAGARRVYTALMVLGIAMMLATCFGFDIAFLSVGKEALWLVFSCFLAYVAFRFDFSPVRVFGIAQAVYFLSSTVGWAVGAAVAPYYGDSMVRMGTGIGLAFMVIVVLVYVFTEGDVRSIMEWSVERSSGARALGSDAVGSAGAAGSVAGSLGTASVPGAFAEEASESDLSRAADPCYGLSARELEILGLFAQGRSANWIADSLTISKNTVRAHLRAIYTKLNVHTRQELLDFLAGR